MRLQQRRVEILEIKPNFSAMEAGRETLSGAFERSRQGLYKSVPAHAWSVTLAWFLVFFLFVTRCFAGVPRLNVRTDFYTVCFIRLLHSCHPGAIKSRKCPLSPVFTLKSPPKRDANRHFKPNTKNIHTLHYRNHCSNSNQICKMI